MPYLGSPGHTSYSRPTASKTAFSKEPSDGTKAYSQWRDRQPDLRVHLYPETTHEGAGSFAPPDAGAGREYSRALEDSDSPLAYDQPVDDSMNGRARSHEPIHGEPHPIQAFKTQTGSRSNASFRTPQSSFPPAPSDEPDMDILRRVLERSEAVEAQIASLKTELWNSTIDSLSENLRNHHLIETNQDTNLRNHEGNAGKISVIGHVFETRFQNQSEMLKSQQESIKQLTSKVEELTAKVQDLSAENEELEDDLSKTEGDVQGLKSWVIRQDHASRVQAGARSKSGASRVDESGQSTAFRRFPPELPIERPNETRGTCRCSDCSGSSESADKTRPLVGRSSHSYLPVSARDAAERDQTRTKQSGGSTKRQATQQNSQRSYPPAFDRGSSQVASAYEDRSAYRGPAQRGPMASKGPSDYPVSSHHRSSTRPGPSFPRSLDAESDEDQSDDGSYVRERPARMSNWNGQSTYDELIYDGP